MRTLSILAGSMLLVATSAHADMQLKITYPDSEVKTYAISKSQTEITFSKGISCHIALENDEPKLAGGTAATMLCTFGDGRMMAIATTCPNTTEIKDPAVREFVRSSASRSFTLGDKKASTNKMIKMWTLFVTCLE